MLAFLDNAEILIDRPKSGVGRKHALHQLRIRVDLIPRIEALELLNERGMAIRHLIMLSMRTETVLQSRECVMTPGERCVILLHYILNNREPRTMERNIQLRTIQFRKELTKRPRRTKLMKALRKKDANIQVVAKILMRLARDYKTNTMINRTCDTADDARLSQRRPSGGDISAGQGKENIPAIVVMLLVA